jgi:hypothetical protein
MKGATRIALIAVLCTLGLAQAYITWGPRSFVPLALGDVSNTSWTSDNNTWSVTGWGDTVAVAFVGTYSGSKWVLGVQGTHYRLSCQDPRYCLAFILRFENQWGNSTTSARIRHRQFQSVL